MTGKSVSKTGRRVIPRNWFMVRSLEKRRVDMRRHDVSAADNTPSVKAENVLQPIPKKHSDSEGLVAC